MNAPARQTTNLPAIAARADVFVGQVLPPDRLEMVVATLPEHVKPERFQRNLVVAVAQHPKLLNCEPVAVFNEVSKAAALGLYLDPQLGEAYLITGWDSRANKEVPQLRLGYRGLIKLARQSGQITTAYAHEVCEKDPCDVQLGTEKKLVHRPDFSQPRGKVLFYYAVAHFADGEVDFEPMSLEAIHRIRDRSDGWRAFKAGKIKSTPWGTDEEEMAKKTVLRRLLKRLPQSPELADALRIEDAEFQEHPETPRLSVVQRLRARKERGAEGFHHAQVIAELDGARIKTGSQLKAEQDAARETAVGAETSQGPDTAEEAGNAVQDADFEPAGASDFPGDRPTSSQAEQGGSGANNPAPGAQAPTLASRVNAVKAAMAKVADQQSLDAIWTRCAALRRELEAKDPEGLLVDLTDAHEAMVNALEANGG